MSTEGSTASTTPGTSDLPVADRAETWRALRGLAGTRRAVGIITLATFVIATAAGLVVPPVLGHIVDLVVDHRGVSTMTAPAILLAVVALVQGLFTAAGRVMVARVGERMLAELRERVVRRALRLPLSRVEEAGTGDVLSRVSGDVDVVSTAVATVVPAVASAALTVGLTIVGLGLLDWRFALAGLVAMPVQVHTLRWYLGTSAPMYARERTAEGRRAQQLVDSIAGARTVRAFGLSGQHTEAVEDRSAAALAVALQTNRLRTRFFGRLNGAEFIGLSAILIVGFVLVRDGSATIGAASAAALYFHRLFDPVNTLLGLFDDAQKGAAGLARLVGVAELPEPARVSQPAALHDDSVALGEVDYAYRTGHPVLHKVSMTIGPGEQVALVGPSGSGKTTLAKLIAGIHQPSHGTVHIGGVPVDALDETALRRAVAMVTQEVHVFIGSIADNLRLARPGADETELHKAIQAVGAENWLAALPAGLHTLVGAGALQLTAAQAQQLALARLALSDSRVILLDEATAEAGSAGSRELERAAATVTNGRTTLVIAHRLSQAAGADRVVVLRDGAVVEEGGHRELLAAGGHYAELWTAWANSTADTDERTT